MQSAELNFIVWSFKLIAGLWVCNHPSPNMTVYTFNFAKKHRICLWWLPIITSTRHPLAKCCITLLLPSISWMSFSNWKVLILFGHTKDLSINLASLPLSMSKRVCIPAMLSWKWLYIMVCKKNGLLSVCQSTYLTVTLALTTYKLT